MTDQWRNKLYFGDNLDIMRRYIEDESVDLIYLDPPFNSNSTYNVLFSERNGSASSAQITAFEDTWHWDLKAEETYREVVSEGPRKLADLLQALRTFLGANDMMAYLTMMAIRLVEMHRILKPTGSIYLHCDPTASHYLKLTMDAVFSPVNFRNEIIWRRSGSHGKMKRYAPIHDVILFYTKSDSWTWNHPKRPYMKGHVETYFVQDERGWRTDYFGNVLTGSGLRSGLSGKPWKGFDPSAKGRHWAIPKALYDDLDEDFSNLNQHEKMDRLHELGFIKINPGQVWPIYERYITPNDGQAMPDIWAYQPYTSGTVFGTDQGIDEDIRWLSPRDQERLGYQTQKPEGLLERIIQASSNEGDLVLDPFCGCGTTVVVAERLRRRWIGIDITHLAISLMRHRLQNTFGSELSDYEVFGDPKDLKSAEALAQLDRFQFEWWALGLVNARPAQDKKKGADSGIDGIINFFDDNSGKAKNIVVQVKSGHVSRSQIATLNSDREREGAVIGAFITLEEPTGPMRTEAASAGFYEPEFLPGHRYPRIQILTIKELLNGKKLEYPRVAPEATFKRAERKSKERPEKEVELL